MNRRRDIPLELFEGRVPNPIAIYRPPILAALAGIGMLDAGMAAFAAVQNVAVGGPITQVQENNPGNQISFRRATTFRIAQLQSTTTLQLTGAQQIDVVIEGSGYIYGIDLHRYITTAGNSAAAAFFE